MATLRGDGLFRDRSLGPFGEPGEGGSGHQDQPPDPAGGGDQGEGGPQAAAAGESRVQSLLSWRLRSVGGLFGARPQSGWRPGPGTVRRKGRGCLVVGSGVKLGKSEPLMEKTEETCGAGGGTGSPGCPHRTGQPPYLSSLPSFMDGYNNSRKVASFSSDFLLTG